MNPEIIWQISKSLVLVVIVSATIYGGSKALSKFESYYDLKNQLLQEEMTVLAKNIVSQKITVVNSSNKNG
jgi:hypothetical protein